MFTSWWFYTYRSSFELRPRLVFTDGYKPDARVGQGTADVPNHCLERYSLDHHFHLLQKGATRGLEDALQEWVAVRNPWLVQYLILSFVFPLQIATK